MRKRTGSRKMSFNSKLIVDVIGASLIVQHLPRIVSGIIRLDPMLQTVAGVGGGYLAGTFLKRPDMANASIALGALDFISPLVNDLLGTGSSIPPQGGTVSMLPVKTGIVKPEKAVTTIDDFLTLNDYVSGWSDQSKSVYRNSY